MQQHTRPSTVSVEKWVNELAHETSKRQLMESLINALDPDDLATIGYPVENLWDPLTKSTDVPPPAKPKLNRYRLQRKLIMTLRRWTQRIAPLRALLLKLRLACDVLTRD